MAVSNRVETGYADVLVGLQYGDEGKAKIIDVLAPNYDVIARFNGGANAGHTIDTPQGQISLKQVPSGIFNENTKLYVGSGCAVNLWKLSVELDAIAAHGIDLRGRLRLSDRCAVVQPMHLLLDQRNGRQIGTTNNGIGPCYADRVMRMRDGIQVNIQLRDLLRDTDAALAAMVKNVAGELSVATDQVRQEVDEQLRSLPSLIDKLRPYVESDRAYLSKLVNQGARVLFEGAQSIMLDVVHGDQPYVTSSHTIPSYAFVGGDLSSRYHRFTIGVAKAVVSRVGQGPFPAELGGERSAKYCADAAITGLGKRVEAEQYKPEELLKSKDAFDVGMALRMMTGEYGTGTGRPRRIGMLDLSQLKEVVQTFGIDFVYINKFDCLSLYEKTVYGGVPVLMPLAEGQSHGEGEVKVLPAFPVLPSGSSLKPEDLPTALVELKAFIECRIGAEVVGVGLGPERDRTAEFKKPEQWLIQSRR